MQSFRTEIEHPLVQKDLIELERKIHEFHGGKIDEERFRTLRLARGIYGQRQFGVQMIRIKIPYGKLSGEQLIRIAKVSDEYSRGRLHITTRQDVQIHHVSLDRTPELWAELERDDITIREACGNTVRNITASEFAGIDPNELFDVRPYADALFQYFLRNPIGQELGRKLKFSFSSGDDDTALSYMHDLGFIPRVQDGAKGFKILVGGGLGSQSRQADVLYEFALVDQIIGITEALIRVFEKHGERTRRMKARLKFLIKEVGIEMFKNWINEELENVPNPIVKIEEDIFPEVRFATSLKNISWGQDDSDAYRDWLESNTFPQKGSSLYAVGIKVHLGDFYTNQARALAKLVIGHTGNELTFTLGQNIIIRHVKASTLPFIYRELEKIGLADPGFNSIADVTACPGTDTCNLGISSSTGLAVVVEDLLKAEYSELVKNEALNIKISGCMNACGQHMIAQIGFQGMSMNGPDKRVLPAIQVLLGGGTLGNGRGRFADKVIKIPSKRALDALRLILNDYALSEKSFLDYYDEKGERYFYDLLKPLSGTENLLETDYLDWGHTRQYEKAVGVGECAGVVIDLVSTLLVESEDKISEAKGAAAKEQFSDAIYYTYQSIVNTAKALLIAEGKKTNSHHLIINDFDEHFIKTNRIKIKGEFSDFALKHKQNVTSESVKSSIIDAVWFYSQAKQLREQEVVA